MIAAPRAYWLQKPFVTSLLLVVKPSLRLWNRVKQHFGNALEKQFYDMDIINLEFKDEIYVLRMNTDASIPNGKIKILHIILVIRKKISIKSNSYTLQLSASPGLTIRIQYRYYVQIRTRSFNFSGKVGGSAGSRFLKRALLATG